MSASKLQSEIIEYIEKNDGYIENTITSSKRGKHDLKACICGIFVSIEVKFEKDKPSKLQLLNAERIKKAGGVVIWAYTFEKFLEGLKENFFFENDKIIG